MVTLLLFAIGFLILIRGANVLVDGSVSLARRLNVSGIVIGLVIVGIGTSIPEFAVAFLGNLLGEGEISLGTIIGSNTFNILFILGLSAVISPLALKPAWVARDLVWNIAAVGIAALFALAGDGDPAITRAEGLLLLILFAAWLGVTLRQADGQDREPTPVRMVTLPIAILMVLAGLAGVLLGGKWVVDGAVAIAGALGMSEAFIGLTLVGVGTSLPELVVSTVAAWRKQVGIAVGNIVGSNIFDFLMIIGASAIVRPIAFPPELTLDLAVTIGSALVLFLSMFVGERYTLKGWQGAFFLAFYLGYLLYLVGRG